MVRKLFKNQTQSKRGVASLYVVIFATILFGIVSLSFMRIILSEAGQSSDDDLSRSAYDAALAGVEDAKRAINEYYRCLQGTGSSGRCSETDRQKLFQPECIVDGDPKGQMGIAKYFNIDYNPEEGIFIQEGNTNTSTFADQAYTCVVVSDKVPDYRGTLTSDTRTKVVPINIGGAAIKNDKFPNVKRITLEWYSQLNMGSEIAQGGNVFHNLDNINPNNKIALKNKEDSPIPPTVAASIILAQKNATSEDFHRANNYDLAGGSLDNSKVVYSTKALVPTNGPSSDGLAWNAIGSSGNVISISPDKEQHETVGIIPDSHQEFACKYTFTLDGATLTEDTTVVLVLSLPYANTATDFKVSMYDGYDDDSLVDFSGAQISVDSTGRTNQLLRRVEVRLDPADLFFPYPQYEVDLSGENGKEIFKKNFWITANCWYSQKSNSWQEETCDQNNRTD